MFMMTKNMLGGLIGAIALNVVHQFAKRCSPDAPEVDKIGMEALGKAFDAAGADQPSDKNLFRATLGGDLLANAAYYSLIGKGGQKHMLVRGAILGAAAGIGALTLTKPMGLDDEPVNANVNRQIMTVAWYTIGGLAAAVALKILKK